MRVGALYLFKRGTCNGERARHWVIAAYHPQSSITWLWVAWWFPPVSIRHPWGKMFFARQKRMPWTIVEI